ncbi:MAG: SNF2 family helicase [Osedax symbiont Rs2]|nr:MAG: SNF2 family helicase [Osedax symbiont Rs2]
MKISVDELDKDYRTFDENNLQYQLSNRLLTPILYLSKRNNKYIVSLGAYIKKNGETTFNACPSIQHNWVLAGNRIMPLPYDAPIFIHEVLKDINPLDVEFTQIIKLMKEGIQEIDINVAPDLFETANTSALTMDLLKDVPGLEANLYPYQEHGVAWMSDCLEQTGGIILADEMGLGKTLQIIALFLLKKPTTETPALIVCPTTLIANWCREIKRFAPSLSFLIHRGADRTGFYKDIMRSQVVITTYDTLVNDITLFRSVEWKFLVCDEAQAAKNPDSKRRRALGLVPAKYTIPVTGTPMENSLLDIWSLTDLAIPGLLDTKDNFISAYPDSEEGAQKLAEITDIVILKRQVKDVANDLPARTDIDLPLELGTAAEEEYERIREETIEKHGVAGQLVAVGQLAIYCAHPWLRIKNPTSPTWENQIDLKKDPRYKLLTPKMEICIRLLKEAALTGKKVLIFAAYNNCGELIKKAAAQEKVPNIYWNSINGATPQEERQSIVDEFSEYNGSAVLILNPKAAGTGLNITAATIVIHYTQNWNPALEMQASARAHRRGQDQPVTIYRLFYQNTVEEVMVERSKWKRDLGEIAVPISTRDKLDLKKALSNIPLMERSTNE